MTRGRKKTISAELPPYMSKRTRGGTTCYYYTKNKVQLPLGKNLQEALCTYSQYMTEDLLKQHPWHRYLFLAEILDRAIAVTELRGVYFLLKGKSICYIGKSNNVLRRVAQHKTKDFDRFAWILCKAEDMDQLEADYIAMFSPKLNLCKPTNHSFNPGFQATEN